MVAYKASKAAIISINRNLGTAYANKGIRVNAVVPGVIGTEMWAFLDREVPDARLWVGSFYLDAHLPDPDGPSRPTG